MSRCSILPYFPALVSSQYILTNQPNSSLTRSERYQEYDIPKDLNMRLKMRPW